MKLILILNWVISRRGPFKRKQSQLIGRLLRYTQKADAISIINSIMMFPPTPSSLDTTLLFKFINNEV